MDKLLDLVVCEFEMENGVCVCRRQQCNTSGVIYRYASARESYITCQLSMQTMCGIDVLLIIIILQSMASVVHFFGFICMILKRELFVFLQ